jgi:TRAP-type C4-dicarboxylate transport system substrate-binding protein
MKKFTALLLAAMLVLSLAACSSSSSNNSSDSKDTSSPANTADTQTGTDNTGDSDSSAADIQTIELKVATAYNETESGGLLWKHFQQTLSDLSDGKITLTIFYGGTLCSATEELSMIQSGGIDLACLRSYAADLPLTTFPETTNLGIEQTTRYYDYVFYENEETSQLLSDELANYNAVYVGSCWAGGGQVCMSTVDVQSLADMGKYACGMTNFESAWRSLGLKNINASVGTGDMYTALNSGLIQWQIISMGPTIGLKIYEVCDYGVVMGMYGAGNNMVMNADMWNSLNDDTRAVIQEAAKETMEYSIEAATQEWDDNIAFMEGEGVTFYELSQEDKDAFADALWQASCDTAYENCVAIGEGDEMATIIAAASDFYGREWSPST